MTLCTTVRISGDDVDVETLWAFCSDLVNLPAGINPIIDQNKYMSRGWTHIHNPLGAGADAALDMYVSVLPNSVGPYSDSRQDSANVVVSFDTGYGYTDASGRDATQLHRYYVTAVGDLVATMGADWIAQDEYTGEWAKEAMPRN